MRLDGKTAVVVGGARGLGRAIAARFIDAGAFVALADAQPSVQQTAEALQREPQVCSSAVVDVRDSATVEQFADGVIERRQSIDIWVNSAGIMPVRGICDMTDDEWSAVIDINLTGTFYGARAAARRMRSSGQGGVIINIASTSGFRASGDGRSHYVATKHGVVGLTKAMARELGPFGIRVLAIAPTLTVTEGVLEAKENAPDVPQSDFASFSERLPLRRLGQPDDVANAALFCASELSSFMTGSTLAVDGGHLAT